MQHNEINKALISVDVFLIGLSAMAIAAIIWG